MQEHCGEMYHWQNLGVWQVPSEQVQAIPDEQHWHQLEEELCGAQTQKGGMDHRSQWYWIWWGSQQCQDKCWGKHQGVEREERTQVTSRDKCEQWTQEEKYKACL